MIFLHVTHPKAASQWIYRILHFAAPNKTIQQNLSLSKFLSDNIEEDKIYPTLFISKKQYDSVNISKDCFIVFRDLRDTLISHYYSLLSSHALMNNNITIVRKCLNHLSTEEGLQLVMDYILPKYTTPYIESWLGTNFIKYEDLIYNDVEILTPILLPHIECSKSDLENIIMRNRFQNLSNGRERGQEDTSHHYRKGIVGDWRNYFSDATKKKFKEIFGNLIIKMGYEKDNNW